MGNTCLRMVRAKALMCSAEDAFYISKVNKGKQYNI